jgi:hypothetical protein
MNINFQSIVKERNFSHKLIYHMDMCKNNTESIILYLKN